MPRQNYSIICLIFLVVAVLVRTAAIAQRVYDMLSPPLGDERAPAITAVITDHTAEPSLTVNAHPIVASVVGASSVEDSPPSVAAENVPDVLKQRPKYPNSLRLKGRRIKE
jgi:hypothetical protein